MRLLVCGGRDYDGLGDAHRMLNGLHEFRPIKLLIHGDATGADSIAKNWAINKGIDTLPFPVTKAQWRSIGKRAGPMRNKRMLDEGKPDLVFALPGGTGTADMVKQARRNGVKVLEV